MPCRRRRSSRRRRGEWMSRAESDAVLARFLNYLQSSRRIRIGILVVIAGLFVAYGARSIYQLLPKRYSLTISGGDIVSNRHYLAHILSEEAAKKGLTLIVRPQRGGSLSVLDAL